MRSLTLGLVFCVVGACSASAQSVQSMPASESGSNASKLGDVLHNKSFAPDERITDTELKAQSGSLSRYSLKFNLAYGGPPLNALYDPYMPNPDNRPRPNRTNISGYMGGRFRVSSDAAWNLNTGLQWYSPYQQVTGVKVQKNRGDNDFTLANPQVTYDRTYLAWGAQGRTSLKGSATTETYYNTLGQFSSVGIEQFFKYNVGQTPLILGLLVPLDFFIYSRDYRATDGKVSNYFLSVIPGLEYKLTETFNFKTSIAYSYSNMRKLGSWWKWDPQAVSQRVGFGWGITRDIYINPFLNFFVDHPAINTTSLSFTTVFSIF